MASLNENAYGPIADSYAQKYGIPTNVFRDAIRKTSNFDPLFKSSNGSGIANLDASKVKGVNTGDVGTSLDIAGQYISSIYKDTQDWEKALTGFIGTPSGDFGGVASAIGAFTDPVGTIEKSSSGILDTIKAWFKSNAYGLMFILFGVVIILASIWVVIQRSSKN